jgi:flavin reductase (DIM6/NTAB) family NADH-FMN oxidoreductase RutF
MGIKLENFYEILAPRCTVLISTIDKDGTPNAAPFSFVTPISIKPPLVLFASAEDRHTLANVRETKQFILNIVPEEFLNNLWICSKSFKQGVNEIKESGLTEKKAARVKPPRIEECACWIECTFVREYEAGDHIIVIGKVVCAEGKDDFMKDGQFDILKAKPVMHITSKRFAVAERIVKAHG